jgi:transcriptional regulator with XRE-family HTH domain
MDVRERVIKAREAKGLNKAELAKKINLSPSALSMFENGKSNLSTKTLIILASELNLNEDWILNGNGDMYAKGSNSGSKNTEGSNPWKDETFKQLKEENIFLKNQIQWLNQLIGNAIPQMGKLIAPDFATRPEGSFSGAVAA